MKTWILFSILFLVAVLGAACGPLSRQLRSGDATSTPPPSPSLAPVVHSVSPTRTQTQPAPQITTAPPRRIQFPPGGISQVVRGKLASNSVDSYVLSARAGQTMTVNVTSYELQMYLAVEGADGHLLQFASTSNWSGRLPATQDYNLRVSTPNGDPASYTLAVTIPPETAQ